MCCVILKVAFRFLSVLQINNIDSTLDHDIQWCKKLFFKKLHTTLLSNRCLNRYNRTVVLKAWLKNVKISLTLLPFMTVALHVFFSREIMIDNITDSNNNYQAQCDLCPLGA